MDVPLISKSTENTLVSALRSAITDVNGGMSPNAALTKHALANGLGPELSSRLVEAFNTSKTLSKLRNSSGEKRAETFELADRDSVVAALYTPAPTEKVALVRYQSPSKINFNTRPAEPAEKTAAAGKLSLASEHTKTALYGIQGNVIIAGRGLIAGIKNARDEFRMHTKRAKENVAGSLNDFVTAFKRADRASWSPLKDIEERLSYHFGAVVKQAMDLAWSQLTDKQRATEVRFFKQAAALTPEQSAALKEHGVLEDYVNGTGGWSTPDEAIAFAKSYWKARAAKLEQPQQKAAGVQRPYLYPLNDPLYKLAEKLVTSIKDAVDLHTEAERFEKKANLVETHFKRQVDLIAGKSSCIVKSANRINGQWVPDEVDDSGSVLTGPHSVDPNAPITIPGDSGAGAAGSVLNPDFEAAPAAPAAHAGRSSSGGGKSEKTPKQPAYDLGIPSVLEIPEAKQVPPRSVFPAAHEGNLRAIRAKLMLNDFISNDPVISGFPVDAVISAYNQLASAVPALSTQPIAMRGLLANMLQREGGLEPMEIRNLLDTEESRRRLRVLGE